MPLFEVRIPVISDKPEDFSLIEAKTAAQAKYTVWIRVSDLWRDLKYTDMRARKAKKKEKRWTDN